MRGLKEGRPRMLMEQTPSQSNWGEYAPLKRPGELRQLSYQAVAHDADAVMYFQWWRSHGSFEMFHSAVVDHDGTGDTRVFREVAEIGRELAALGTQTLGTRVQSAAAVLFDWDCWWVLDHASFPCRDFAYVPLCREYFAALYTLGISADVVTPDADLSGYSLLAAPVLYLLKPGWAEKLERFVSEGGTLALTFRSGCVNETSFALEGGSPDPCAGWRACGWKKLTFSSRTRAIKSVLPSLRLKKSKSTAACCASVSGWSRLCRSGSTSVSSMPASRL